MIKTPEERAAIRLRDLLIPLCPTVVKDGKRHRILPVCYISLLESGEKVLRYSVPPNSKEADIPDFMNGFKAIRHEWKGGADKKTQDMALKYFGTYPQTYYDRDR